MKFLIFILVFASTVSAQLLDNYGTKPKSRSEQTEVVKFHVALKLVEGGWTPEQREVMTDVILSPRIPTKEEESLFTPADFRDVFHAIGTVNIGEFVKTFRMPVLWDKKRHLISLFQFERAAVWRHNFAYNIVVRELNRKQIAAVVLMADAANTHDPDRADLVDLSSFDRETAGKIFENIGPYQTKGSCDLKKQERASLQQDCICAVDYYNYSCVGSCGGGTGCTVTDGGCSVLWLRNCTGMCTTEPDVLLPQERGL